MSLLEIVAGVLLLLAVAGVAAYVASLYNRLVRVEERVNNAWADIDVLLEQRRDAIEKLADTAQQALGRLNVRAEDHPEPDPVRIRVGEDVEDVLDVLVELPDGATLEAFGLRPERLDSSFRASRSAFRSSVNYGIDVGGSTSWPASVDRTM